MARIIENGQLAQAPPPGPLRYGVFRAATVTEDLSEKEIAAGFQIPAVDCGVARVYDAMCDPANAQTKVIDEGLTYMDAMPYCVYSTRQCGIVGRTEAELSGSVRSKLLASEQLQVELSIWQNTLPILTPNLTDTTGVVTVTPGAAGADAAIAALEESFYSEYGYVGTIHVNQAAYGSARYARMVEVADSAITSPGTLVTPLGSKWAFGAGYGTTGPLGVAPAAGSVWAFMTPPVWIRRSGIIQQDSMRDALDRPSNQYVGLAERVYAHTWTCPVVHAVQIPLTAVGAA
jgi:hypothetical protein